MVKKGWFLVVLDVEKIFRYTVPSSNFQSLPSWWSQSSLHIHVTWVSIAGNSVTEFKKYSQFHDILNIVKFQGSHGLLFFNSYMHSVVSILLSDSVKLILSRIMLNYSKLSQCLINFSSNENCETSHGYQMTKVVWN